MGNRKFDFHLLSPSFFRIFFFLGIFLFFFSSFYLLKFTYEIELFPCQPRLKSPLHWQFIFVSPLPLNVGMYTAKTLKHYKVLQMRGWKKKRRFPNVIKVKYKASLGDSLHISHSSLFQGRSFTGFFPFIFRPSTRVDRIMRYLEK